MKIKHFPLKRRIAPVMLLAGLCVAPLALSPTVSFAQNLPTLGDTEREDLSPRAERKLGEQIMNSVRRDPDYIDDDPVSEYLNKLGSTLLDARPDARGETHFDFEFFGVRDAEINAFALPGGYIGIHTGLILMTQNESELASVIGHEIGHVAQRHIARMISSQKFDSLIPIAALVLAALASRASPDAAMALAVGGQGLAIQKQLAFSRDAEREADRMGFLILRDAGYDTTAMVTFFGRLQASMRTYNDNLPPFLLSHPLTSERIADIQDRTLAQRYKQHADSWDYLLMKSRVRVLQNSSTQGLIDARIYFENELKSENEQDQITASLAANIAAKYGLAFVYYKQKNFVKAQQLLDQVLAKIKLAPAFRDAYTQTSAFASLAIDIPLAARDLAGALEKAEQARQLMPSSQGIARQYVKVLIAAGRNDDAVRFLHEQVVAYRNDPRWQTLLAEAYAAQGKQASQHLALAQAYALSESYEAALQQLTIARTEKDLQYFDSSVIDALEREWQEKRKEEIKEEKKNR